MKKELDFYEIEVKFLVRKGSFQAETKAQLLKNVEAGIGTNSMNCIEAEDIKIKIK